MTSFSYADIVAGRSLLSLRTRPYDVIMIDRYDLFQSDDLVEVVSNQKESIILIDCKTGIEADLEAYVVYKEMREDGIVVYE